MRPPILPEGETATFADYFKLNADIEDILAIFECSYRLKSCELPRKKLDAGRIGEIKRHFERALPHVNLNSEVARREFLIAPVLLEVALHTEAKISVEFPLEVDARLKGTLDYFVRAKHNILVVEAKNADLKRGFNQLAVELVALDRWAEDSTEPRFYGAISMGDAWKFGFLDRAEKAVTEDLNLYGVPTDLEDVMEILAAVLTE